MRSVVLAAVTALVAIPVVAQDFVRKSSPYGVAETVDRLQSAIEEGGAKIVATVDHSGAAKKAGMDLPAATVIIFGNPNMGTPMMQEAPSMALDLPLRIAVYETAEGDTELAYPDLRQVAQDHGVPEGMEQIESAIRALEGLTDKAVRQE